MTLALSRLGFHYGNPPASAVGSSILKFLNVDVRKVNGREGSKLVCGNKDRINENASNN